MTPYYADDLLTLYLGDCVEVMRELPAESVDAVVTDPPAGISIMGKGWDHHKGGRDAWVAWMTVVMGECYRLLKPGGHILVWALPRTSHWTGWAIESAGFEMRDKIIHAFASGFPKSLNLPGGLGTALKPAYEDWWLARKPLRGTVAANVLAHGTGALNIGATRIGTADGHGGGAKATSGFVDGYEHDGFTASQQGRWPPNLLLSDPIFDGGVEGVVGGGQTNTAPAHLIRDNGQRESEYRMGPSMRMTQGDAGTYSRFFLVPKSSRSDREPLLRGQVPDVERPNGNKWTDQDYRTGRIAVRSNVHPTVKPLDLMRHLVRLVTPPGGTVLDPFIGSGTTAIAANAEGFRAIGIEREQEYLDIAVARLAHQEIGLGLDVTAPVRKRTVKDERRSPEAEKIRRAQWLQPWKEQDGREPKVPA